MTGSRIRTAHARYRHIQLWLALIAAVTASMVVGSVHLTTRASAATTGTGGLFTSATGRMINTRIGTAGYTTPMTVNTWRPFVVAGTNGIPNQEGPNPFGKFEVS